MKKYLRCFFNIVIIIYITFLLGNVQTWGTDKCSKNRPPLTEIELSYSNEEDDCTTSLTSDFQQRESEQEKFTDCNYTDVWGPFPKLSPKAKIPINCNRIKWQQNRILEVLKFTINKGWNYCHHRTPYWLPPQNDDVKNTKNVVFRKPIDKDDTTSVGFIKGTCSLDGFPNEDITVESKWRGIDCTNYTSFVYNFAFGAYISTGVGIQSCSRNEPGTILKTKDFNSFQPGDILYITGKSSLPNKITHAIIWTGEKVNYTDTDSPFYVETLLSHLNESQKNTVKAYIIKNKNPSIFVIADSHFDGPNYRPFAGWYMSAFSHARRLIGSLKSDPQEFPEGFEMTYDESNFSCNIKIKDTN